MDYLLIMFTLLLTLLEVFAMYNLKKFNVTKDLYYYLFGIVIYIIVVNIFTFSFNYEKLGSMNHAWNIGSSIFGFIVGYFIFNESLNNTEFLGVGLSLVGLFILACSRNDG